MEPGKAVWGNLAGGRQRVGIAAFFVRLVVSWLVLEPRKAVWANLAAAHE